LTELANTFQISHLCAGVGDRFSENHFGVGPDGCRDGVNIRCIDQGDFDTEQLQGAKQTAGITEYILTCHQMIATSQERCE
jgi:hypothetical protein